MHIIRIFTLHICMYQKFKKKLFRTRLTFDITLNFVLKVLEANTPSIFAMGLRNKFSLFSISLNHVRTIAIQLDIDIHFEYLHHVDVKQMLLMVFSHA